MKSVSLILVATLGLSGPLISLADESPAPKARTGKTAAAQTAQRPVKPTAEKTAARVAAPAVASEPDALVRNVTEEMLEIIRNDQDIRSGNTQRVVELVEQKVLPHFDFKHMTALAVGKDWRKASEAQQAILISEFRDLLVRTYSTALASYKDEVIDYKPFKMNPGETDVTVRTQILQPGARQPINLDYSLEKTGASWKVYDVVVAGVSLVTNYRSSFTTEVRNGGIDGLIRTLQAKNRSLKTAAEK